MADLEFETSALWQAAFGERPKDRQAAARAALKRKFLDLREKVAVLVAQIAKDIPGLTVHDVTHLDALWETASLIAGSDQAINPAEAYVLGASILLHDAGMCLAAYPGGLASIRETTEWRDTITSLLRREDGGEVPEALLHNPLVSNNSILDRKATRAHTSQVFPDQRFVREINRHRMKPILEPFLEGRDAPILRP